MAGGKDDSAFEELDLDNLPDEDEGEYFEEPKVLISGAEAYAKPKDDEEDEVEIQWEDQQSKPEKKAEAPKEDKDESRRKSRAQERIQKLANERKMLREQMDQVMRRNQELEDRLSNQTRGAAQAQARILAERMKDLQEQQTRALEQGEYGKHAELTQQVADTNLRLQVLKYQDARTPTPRQGQQGYPQQPMGIPEAAQDWIKENEWFQAPITQDDMIRQRGAVVIGRMLMAEGFDAESDEYYEELDRRLEKRFGRSKVAEESPEPKVEPKKETRQDRPVMTGEGRQGVVRRRAATRVRRLTADDRQIIEDLGISPQEYVAQLEKREQDEGQGWTEIA